MEYHSQSNEDLSVLEFEEPAMSIACAPGVYRPSDDSALLIRSLKTLLAECWPEHEKRKSLAVLEIGTGTGAVGIALLKMRIDHLVMTDISPKAIRCARGNLRRNQLSAELIHSSLFQGLDTEFNLIVFNPPYLPQEEKEPDDLLTKALCGGRQGHETMQRFLERLPLYLKDDGKAVIILSSLTPLKELQEGADIEWRLVGRESFFFERIYCYSLSKSKVKK